jgi:hypothetical protein
VDTLSLASKPIKPLKVCDEMTKKEEDRNELLKYTFVYNKLSEKPIIISNDEIMLIEGIKKHSK